MKLTNVVLLSFICGWVWATERFDDISSEQKNSVFIVNNEGAAQSSCSTILNDSDRESIESPKDKQVTAIINDLVQLRLKSDMNFQMPGQVNYPLLAFERAYAEAASAISNLRERFLQAYNLAMDDNHAETTKNLAAKEKRKTKTRIVTGYRISSRDDIKWEQEFIRALVIEEHRFALFNRSPQEVIRVDTMPADDSEAHENLLSFAMKISEDRFVSASWDHTALIWQVGADGSAQVVTRFGEAFNENPLFGHTAKVNFILPISEGRFITGSDDGSAILWGIDQRGQSDVIARMSIDPNSLGPLDREGYIINATTKLIGDDLFILTRDNYGREIVWEPEYLEAGDEL